MARFYVLVLSIVLIFTACSGSQAPEEKKEAPPEVGAPEAPAEEPYKGGLTKEMRIADAQMIVGTFDRGYAPREWKKEFLGISFEDNSKAFLEAAQQDISDIEFYDLIARYLVAFEDAHVGYFIPSSAYKYLPFVADDIDGHIMVVYVRDEAAGKIAIGEEILKIDGRPATEVRDELLPYARAGNPIAKVKRATRFLASRPQQALPKLPEGDSATITVAPIGGEPRDVVLEWKLEGDELAPLNGEGIDLTSKALVAQAGPEARGNILDSMRTKEMPFLDKSTSWLIGHSDPFFALGDNFIERKKGPYYSGVFVAGDRKIGLLRIHTYSSDNIDFNEAIAELEEEIPYFEESTDALIIDQTDNTGGNWCFTLKIASMLFDRPFNEVKDQWRANRYILGEIENTIGSDDASEDDKKILSAIKDNIRLAMEEGRLLTDPFAECTLDGIIEPYRSKDGIAIAYTKPILILINEFSISGGDYFPALIQDNRRATLFGQTTMGAGGSVMWYKQPVGYSEVKYSHTISLGWRDPEIETPDGKKTHHIENVGAIPDIEYKVTLDDFMGGYQLYRDAAVKAALSLVGNVEGEVQQ